MTRLVLAALAALFVFPTAQAQQATFGLKAGLNVSDFSGNDAPATNPRLGFMGGATADIALTPQFSFRPEVLYTQKGAVDENNSDVRLAVDYVEVPVLAAFTVPATDTGLLIGAYAGPTFAFKVSESLDGPLGSLNADLFNSTDIGGAVGVTVGAGAFAVDGRYTLSLTDAADNQNIRNNAFTIAAVYHFGR